MKQATVAVEDQRFYEHHGVDFQSLFRAIVADIRAGSTVQGGSTITEQYVKNAYVGNERTYTRKIREAVLAWQLEDRWSKDKILTEYLNTIFYGDNAYGVEAAAETYFHVHAAQLTLKQAALLAALPKAPTQFNPVVDPQEAKARRDVVLQLMAQQGYITQQQAQATIAKPLGVYKHPLNKDNSLAAYFTDYVTRVLTRRYGSREVFEGGLKVYTSIDLTLAARRHRRHQEHHRAAELRLQAFRGPRRHRPQERLHPHHGRRPRLQEAAVQPRLAGASASPVPP